MGRRMRQAIAALGVACAAALAVAVAAADRGLSLPSDRAVVVAPEEISLLNKIANFMWQTDGNSYQHVWPVTHKTNPSFPSISLTSASFLLASTVVCFQLFY